MDAVDAHEDRRAPGDPAQRCPQRPLLGGHEVVLRVGLTCRHVHVAFEHALSLRAAASHVARMVSACTPLACAQASSIRNAGGRLWHQLYILELRQECRSLTDVAEDAGGGRQCCIIMPACQVQACLPRRAMRIYGSHLLPSADLQAIIQAVPTCLAAARGHTCMLSCRPALQASIPPRSPYVLA